jgi:hypothetical protein
MAWVTDPNAHKKEIKTEKFILLYESIIVKEKISKVASISYA